MFPSHDRGGGVDNDWHIIEVPSAVVTSSRNVLISGSTGPLDLEVSGKANFGGSVTSSNDISASGDVIAVNGLFDNIRDNALTNTRVIFAGTQGLLEDDADFTYTTATDTLSAPIISAVSSSTITGTTISGSGQLFASLSAQPSNIGLDVVTYNSVTGEFFTTGSYPSANNTFRIIRAENDATNQLVAEGTSDILFLNNGTDRDWETTSSKEFASN